MRTFVKLLVAIIVVLVIVALALGLALGFQSAKVTVSGPYVVGVVTAGQYVAYVPFTSDGSKPLSKAFMNRGWLSTDAITGSTVYGRVGAVVSSDGNKTGYVVLEFATAAPLKTTAASASDPAVAAVGTLLGGLPPKMDFSTATPGSSDSLRLWFI